MNTLTTKYKTGVITALGMMLCLSGAKLAHAETEPNGSYTSFSLSYRSTTFSQPICVGNECHSGLSGPSMVYAYQFAPNFALGLTASYLQSSGNTSSLKSTSNAFFLESIIGLGSSVDVGALIAPLTSSLQACSTLTALCTMTDDKGTDLGVFGRLYIDEHKASSIELSYDAVTYQTAGRSSIIGLSLVTVLAQHHRLALYANQVQDVNGNNTSSNLSYGYSYLF